MLKNRNGSTFAMLIVIIAILSVLSLTVLKISLTDNLQYVQQDKKMQSYYLARAGADIVSEHIINNPLTAPDLYGLESSQYDQIGNGHFVVTVNEDSVNDEIILVSTGTYDNQNTDVTLTLSEVRMSHAIFSNEILDVSSMGEVYGDLGSNQHVIVDDGTGNPPDRNVGDDETDDMQINMDEIFEMFGIDFPSDGDLDFQADIYENTSYFYTLGSKEINNFIVSAPGSGLETKFDATIDIEILVDTIEIKGDIEIFGDGKVTIYVKTKATFKNPSVIPDHHPDDFMIVMAPGSDIILSTPIGFSGRIIAPEANVIMTSGSSVEGSIIANSYDGTSNANVKYVEPLDGEYVLGYKRELWE